MYDKLYFGQIVISGAGHDKGQYYVIIEANDEYVYLVDGKSKKLSNPKKKNRKHIQLTNEVCSEIVAKHNGGNLLNKDIIKVLKEYEIGQSQSEGNQHVEEDEDHYEEEEFPKPQKFQTAIEDAVKSLLVEEIEKEK